MTVLLDIAALTVLAAALAAVPLHGLRHEARITREIREARAAAESRPALPEADAPTQRTQHVVVLR
jgi:hypothetical protein